MLSLDPKLSLECATEFGQLRNLISNPNTKSSYQVIEYYASKLFNEFCNKYYACLCLCYGIILGNTP